VSVSGTDLAQVQGCFETIFLWDVLEHIEDDIGAVRRISALLAPGGRLLIAVPSNPREWRWDDLFYGHFRRYTVDDLSARLEQAGMTPVLFWDFTFPVFWLLRRLYTLLKRPPRVDDGAQEERTKASSTVNA